MLKRAKHSHKFSNYHRRLFVEPLEPRRLLATLLTGGKTVTYQDVDGDTVTVALSKAVLTSANVNSVFTFDSGAGAVNGSNATAEQLQEIDLTQLGATVAAGLNITITAKPGVFGNFNFGDGFVNVGFINAAGINLGTISVHGDLGRIDAGDGTSAKLGLTSLSVHSMGVYGTSTQAAGGNLKSTIKGKLGTLNVTGDINGAYIDVEPGANSAQVPGTIGAVNIGGSLIGTGDNNNEGGPNDSGDDDGVIFASGSIGPISIKGSIQGRTGILSAHDSYSGLIYTATGNIGSVKIGGSVVGGNGPLYTGTIDSSGNLGAVTISGSLVGKGDGSDLSGAISSVGTMGNVTIGGSVIGGGDSTTEFSGLIFSIGNMGAVTVGGSVVGSVSLESALIHSGGTMGNVKIGGSVLGGAGNNSGYINSTGNMAAVTIGQDLQGGGGALSGNLGSGNLGNVTIGGSLTNGDIVSSGIIGQVKIGGSIVGSTISALGQATPKAPNDLAIAGLTVGGRVEDAQILAGYSFDVMNFNPASADAQIGNVSVGGDWIASNLLAGAKPTGSGQFEKITGGTDNAAITSSIASITIAGEVLGTLPSVNNTDSYGFAAEWVKSLTIGGTKIKLLSGSDNDYFAIGTTADIALQEV